MKAIPLVPLRRTSTPGQPYHSMMDVNVDDEEVATGLLDRYDGPEGEL